MATPPPLPRSAEATSREGSAPTRSANGSPAPTTPPAPPANQDHPAAPSKFAAPPPAPGSFWTCPANSETAQPPSRGKKTSKRTSKVDIRQWSKESGLPPRVKAASGQRQHKQAGTLSSPILTTLETPTIAETLNTADGKTVTARTVAEAAAEFRPSGNKQNKLSNAGLAEEQQKITQLLVGSLNQLEAIDKCVMEGSQSEQAHKSLRSVQVKIQMAINFIRSGRSQTKSAPRHKDAKGATRVKTNDATSTPAA
jgi:hypothetical protein